MSKISYYHEYRPYISLSDLYVLSDQGQQAFIDSIAPYAIKAQQEYGVPASITIAQAILESGWGKSKLTKEANNYFGIKTSKAWKGPTYTINTGEYDKDGNYYIEKSAKFRKYGAKGDSFLDHSRFLLDNSRYDSLFDSDQYQLWAYGLQKAGYSTSPKYAVTLIGLINKYDLSQYDKKAEATEEITATATKTLRRYRPFIFGGLLALAALGTGYYYVTHKNES